MRSYLKIHLSIFGHPKNVKKLICQIQMSRVWCHILWRHPDHIFKDNTCTYVLD